MLEKRSLRTTERLDPHSIIQVLVDVVNWLNDQREESVSKLLSNLSKDQILGLEKLPDVFQKEDFLALGVIRMLIQLNSYNVYQSAEADPVSTILQKNVLLFMNSVEVMDFRTASSLLREMVSEFTSNRKKLFAKTSRTIVSSSLVEAQIALLQFIRNDETALKHLQDLVDFQNEHPLLPDQLRVFIESFQSQFPGLIELENSPRAQPTKLIARIREVLS